MKMASCTRTCVRTQEAMRWSLVRLSTFARSPRASSLRRKLQPRVQASTLRQVQKGEAPRAICNPRCRPVITAGIGCSRRLLARNRTELVAASAPATPVVSTTKLSLDRPGSRSFPVTNGWDRANGNTFGRPATLSDTAKPFTDARPSFPWNPKVELRPPPRASQRSPRASMPAARMRGNHTLPR